MKTKAKAKRIVAWMLAFFTLCSVFVVGLSPTVSAAAAVKEVKITDFPRSQDPNKSGWGHGELRLMNGWYESASSKMALRCLEDYNSPICYCIEPGIGQHTGDEVSQKGEDYWDYMPGNGTVDAPTMQRLIGRILQYGYTGNVYTSWTSSNPTHVDQMGNAKATQILIHEVIVGERRADFSKIDAHTYGLNNVKEQITSSSPIYAKTMEHYRRIEAEVQAHTVRPNFGGTQFDMTYDGSKYTVTLTDSNNVLSKYNFASNSNLSFSKSGNKLTISTTAPADKMTVTANKIESNRRAFVVWSDGVTSKNHSNNVQDIISYGAQVSDPVTMTFSLRVTTGNVKLVKTSEDNVVEGFTFHVSGAGVNKDVTTGKDGSIVLNGLKAGETLTLTEKLTEEQSRYVQPSSQTVTIKAGQTTTVQFDNRLKRGSAIFQKTDGENDKEIETKDGVFQVLQWSNAKQDYVQHSTMKYDAQKGGYVTTSDLIVTSDNDGKFRWVEEKAPTGYTKPTENTIDFEITEDGQIYHINGGKVTNSAQKGRVGAIKFGEVLTGFDFMQTEFGLKYSPIYEEQSLDGAVLDIYAMEDTYFNGELKYKQGELIDTITTVAGKYTYSKDIYIGDHGTKLRVVETQAPDNFFLGANEYEVELTYQGQEVQLVTQNIEVHNERQKLKLRLHKEIEENIYYPNPEAYKDVIFGVFAAEDIVDEDGTVLLEKGSLVDCFGINESGDGVSQTDFPPDTKWYLQELQTADGLILNDKQYEFSFAADRPDLPLLWIDVNEQYGEIENNVVKGFVEFKKVSSLDDSSLIATYGVFRASDDMLIEEKQSSLTEWTRFDELPKGEYYLMETVAPEHYHEDQEKYPFFIGEDNVSGVTIQITVSNEPVIGALVPEYHEDGGSEGEGGLHVPQTGDELPIVPMAAIAVSSAAVITITSVIGIKKNRKKKK